MNHSGNNSGHGHMCTNCTHNHDNHKFGNEVLEIFGVVIGSLVTLENIVSFMAVFGTLNHHKHLKRLLLNMNIADASLGAFYAIGNILALLYKDSWEEHELACYVKVLCVIYLLTVVMANTTLISLDRLLVLTKPFEYHSFSTPNVTVLCVILTWGLPMLILTSAFVGTSVNLEMCHVDSQRTFLTLAGVRGFLLLTIVVSQIRVHHLVKSQINKIGITIVSDEPSKHLSISRMNKKLTNATEMAIVPYLFFCLPHIAMNITMGIDPAKVQNHNWHLPMGIATFICVSHGLIHPITYCWALSVVRRRLVKLFCCASVAERMELNISTIDDSYAHYSGS